MLVGRGLITREQCRAILKQLQDDLESNRLVPSAIDLDRVFVDASELSRLHTAQLLARSLDLLHVAAAHVMMCSTFVSADDRKLAVAKASGLTVVDIKRRTRRQRRIRASWQHALDPKGIDRLRVLGIEIVRDEVIGLIHQDDDIESGHVTVTTGGVGSNAEWWFPDR